VVSRDHVQAKESGLSIGEDHRGQGRPMFENKLEAVVDLEV
jgi:hypothetical protein